MKSIKILKGDVVWVNLGQGVGSEQSGLRPCLVIQNDVGNKYSPTTMICPITKQHKGFDLLHLFISGMQEEHSIALFEQVRVVDKHRITEYIKHITDAEMIEANKLILLTFGL